MVFEIEERAVLTVWGFSVATGWIVSYFLHPYFEALSLVAFWSVVMSWPVIVSIKWMAQNSGSSLPVTWILTTAIALGMGVAVLQGYLTIPDIESYAVFWFFLPASAFAVTSYYFEGLLKHLYVSAAVINFMLAGIMLFQSSIMDQYYELNSYKRRVKLIDITFLVIQ
ncbi:hypothetical protein HRED_03075 [Candidatus Haloredivivus sp. G17]|nr:hypothetical protein HRED_03075 [Candidatus Haloredivivus sp. G17]